MRLVDRRVLITGGGSGMAWRWAPGAGRFRE